MAAPKATPRRVAPAAGPATEYPTAKYRKVKVSDKHPNGYEARQVASPEDEARFDPKVWKDSPADL